MLKAQSSKLKAQSRAAEQGIRLNDLNEQNQTKDPDDLNLYLGI
jgi:hypothetical protein